MRILIFDGHSFFFRAYYAAFKNNNKTTGIGTTNIFLSMLDKISDNIYHDMIIIVFDSKERLHKKDLLETYKSKRLPRSDDFLNEERKLFDKLFDMEITNIRLPHYEADEIISAIAKLALEKGIQSVIATQDKDMLQLVKNNGVLICNNNTLYSEELVESIMGIRPDQIAEYLALMGDQIDDIPGVPNFGKKTTTSVLRAFNTIDNLYENLDKVSDKMKENLLTNKEALETYKQLTSLEPSKELLDKIKEFCLF